MKLIEENMGLANKIGRSYAKRVNYLAEDIIAEAHLNLVEGVIEYMGEDPKKVKIEDFLSKYIDNHVQRYIRRERKQKKLKIKMLDMIHGM